MSKFYKIFVLSYIAGAIFTNSYMRQFRYEVWYNENPSKLHYVCQGDANFRCTFGTIFWLFYVTAHLADKIVHSVAHTNIKVESPEILK